MVNTATWNRSFRIVLPKRLLATLACALVALIWGSSLVLAKQTLARVEPLMLAGLRYSLAAGLLLPFLARRLSLPRNEGRMPWIRLALIGICAYGAGNAAMFGAMKFLPAATGSFGLSLLPALVLLIGLLWLREAPTRAQVAGLTVVLLGVCLFFVNGVRGGGMQGYALLGLALCGYLVLSLVGRELASSGAVGTLELTALPLTVGGGATLAVALAVYGVPRLPSEIWLIIIWQAVVNTAVAYGLYNFSLRRLKAFEANALLNLSPVAATGLGWAVLGEVPAPGRLLGLVLVVGGLMLITRPGSD